MMDTTMPMAKVCSSCEAELRDHEDVCCNACLYGVKADEKDEGVNEDEDVK